MNQDTSGKQEAQNNNQEIQIEIETNGKLTNADNKGSSGNSTAHVQITNTALPDADSNSASQDYSEVTGPKSSTALKLNTPTRSQNQRNKTNCSPECDTPPLQPRSGYNYPTGSFSNIHYPSDDTPKNTTPNKYPTGNTEICQPTQDSDNNQPQSADNNNCIFTITPMPPNENLLLGSSDSESTDMVNQFIDIRSFGRPDPNVDLYKGT